MFRPALLVAVTLAGPVSAADWPQFLGPTRDNTSSETVAPWPDAPKVRWKQPVGPAHSSPVVAGGVVYAFYQPAGKNADALAAFDAVTGQRKWEKSYDREAYTPKFGVGPRATPAVSGGRVFTLGGTGVLACWDAGTGDVKWKVDALKEFKAPNLFFGVSTSPTVVGDTVVVMVGGTGHGVVGFDVATGKTAWQATDDPASYASPLVTGDGAGRQLVFLTGSHLRGLSPAGGPLWAVPFKDLLNESSTTPVKVGDVVVGGSVTAGSIGVRVTQTGNTWATETVWKNPALTCYFSTPVAVGDHLYMVNGSANPLKKPTITLRCVEAKTGKVAWEKANVGKYHAAFTRTGNGKLLGLDDAGRLLLVDPDPKEYKELARSKVCGATWAHPALSGGVVYVRDENDLIAVKVGG